MSDEEVYQEEPAKEAEELEQPEAAAGEIEEAEEQETQQKPSGVQRRINELTRERRKAEREAEYWRQFAMQNQQKPEQPTQEKPAETKKPDRDQYDDEDAYLEALADWRYDQREQSRQQEQQKTEQQRRQQQSQQELVKQVQSVTQKGTEEFEDYEDVVFDANIPFTDAMVYSIAEMDGGHLVAYHLGKNPQKAAEIAKKSTYRQAVELSKIEDQLTKKPQKKQTQAPAPETTVKGGGEKATKDPSKMSTDEWMKWRWSQVQQR